MTSHATTSVTDYRTQSGPGLPSTLPDLQQQDQQQQKLQRNSNLLLPWSGTSGCPSAPGAQGFLPVEKMKIFAYTTLPAASCRFWSCLVLRTSTGIWPAPRRKRSPTDKKKEVEPALIRSCPRAARHPQHLQPAGGGGGGHIAATQGVGLTQAAGSHEISLRWGAAVEVLHRLCRRSVKERVNDRDFTHGHRSHNHDQRNAMKPRFADRIRRMQQLHCAAAGLRWRRPSQCT